MTGSARRMRYLMSARPSRDLFQTLASLSALRYSPYDADGDASDRKSDDLDLVDGLCSDACSGGSHTGAGRRAVCGVCFGDRNSRGRGVVQRVVAHGPYHDSGGIEGLLVGGRVFAERRTCVYVSGRWNDVGGTSGGGRFCDGRFREHQRYSDGPIGMV